MELREIFHCSEPLPISPWLIAKLSHVFHKASELEVICASDGGDDFQR